MRYRGALAKYNTPLDQYMNVGIGQVGGWLAHDVVFPLQTLADAQTSAGITGGAAEIGVHHGQLFILLALLVGDEERSVAIDLFERQAENSDGSGKGDREIFEQNMADANVARSQIELITANSMDVAAEQIRESVNGPVRLFSVDGGHTPELTINDLHIAEASLAEGGLVILDDVFSSMWPGVIEGLLTYLDLPQTLLTPFAFIGNKTLLAHPDRSQFYRDALEGYTPYINNRKDTFFGHPVTILRA